MAVIPTGTASLRGVGPRAPAIRSFDLDVEGLASAATAPARVQDVIGTAQARRREREIQAETFDFRKSAAIQDAMTENDAAFNRGQDSAAVRAADQLAREAAAEADRLRTEQSQIQSEILANNRNRIVKAGTTKQGIEEQKLSDEQRKLSGIAIETFEKEGDKVIKKSGTRTPTGDDLFTSEVQLDPTEIAARKAAQQAAILRSKAYAKSIEIQAANAGKKVTTSIQKIDGGSYVGDTGFVIIQTDREGNVSSTEYDIHGNVVGPGAGMAEIESGFAQPGAGPQRISFPSPTAAPAPGGEAESLLIPEPTRPLFESTLPPDETAAPVAVANAAADATAAAGGPVTAYELDFQPTGAGRPGYDLGSKHKMPNGSEWIYTGGNPQDSRNFIQIK